MTLLKVWAATALLRVKHGGASLVVERPGGVPRVPSARCAGDTLSRARGLWRKLDQGGWIVSGEAKGYTSLNGRVWIIPFAVC